jgi:hypothetical protein
MKTKFPKKCNCCGKVYKTLKEFRALKLPASGIGESDDSFFRMIWRNCPCGSTLATILEEY